MDDEQRTQRLMKALAGTRSTIPGPYNVIGVDVTDTHLFELAGWADLEHLSLYRCPITDRSLDPICRFRRLMGLDIGGTKITSAGIGQAKLPISLFCLGVSLIHLTDEAVSRIELLPRLKTLNCNGCGLSVDRMARLVVMPNLGLLEAMDCQIADRSARKVSVMNPAVRIALPSGGWKAGIVRRWPPNAILPKF